MPINIVLIRHLKTKNEKIFLGCNEDLDIVGNDLWKVKEISRLLNKINVKSDVVESSPLKRCIKTGKILSEYIKASIKIKENFREIDFGIFGGMTKEEIIKKFPKLWEERKKNKWYFRHPNGESYEDLSQRVWPDILNTKKNRIIVTHSNVIYVVLAKILNLEHNFRLFMHNLKIGYGAMVVIEKQSTNKFKIIEVVNWD